MVARGLWRSWVEVNGVDKWSARLELKRGEWIDVAQADYDAAGHTPAFWDLPLKEDYMEVAQRQLEPIDLQLNRVDLEYMPVLIVAAMLAAAVTATFLMIYMFFNR